MTAGEPSHAILKEQLESVRVRLLALHKALIDSERVEYERSFGTLESPQQFLKVLINDPWFAWLKPVSGLVVQIDEMLEGEEPLRLADVERVKKSTQRLVEVREETDDSRRSYFEALQREPEVILAHAALMKVLKG